MKKNENKEVQRLLETLKDMALQHLLSDIDSNIMSHDFISSNENCLELLKEYGIVKTDDDIYFEEIKDNEKSLSS